MRRFLFILILGLSILAGVLIYRQFVAVALIAWGDDQATRDQALAYAPGNPAVIAARAKYLTYRAELSAPELGVAELRRAVTLTPYDYRYWLELGRAAETNGESEVAARAYERARTLAPRYFETAWTWANFKLRNGESAAAIEAFHQALLISENRPGVTNGRAALNVYDVLAQSLGLDLPMLQRVAPADDEAQSWLAWYLASRGELDPAMEIFRRLPRHDGVSRQELVRQLLHAAQGAGQFAVAREAWDGLGGNNPATTGLVANGGFETAPLTDQYAPLRDSGLGFDWVMARHAEVLVRRDDERPFAGQRSLLVSFPMAMTSPFANLSQLVLVEPGRTYRFSLHCRTSNLPAETPWIEIMGLSPGPPTEPTPLGRMDLPRDAADWQSIAQTLTVPGGVTALKIVLRSPLYRDVDPLRRADLRIDELSMVRVEGDGPTKEGQIGPNFPPTSLKREVSRKP